MCSPGGGPGLSRREATDRTPRPRTPRRICVAYAGGDPLVGTEGVEDNVDGFEEGLRQVGVGVLDLGVDLIFE